MLLSTNSHTLSVYEVTRIIDRQISVPALQNIAVVGEITEYRKVSSSGHVYFTLKDKDLTSSQMQEKPAFNRSAKESAILQCTLWRGDAAKLSFQPKIGDEIQVIGSISLYYQGGKYNFNVRSLQKLGLGNLFLKIQALRQNLVKEGIINPDLRKKIPKLPKKIGIVTGMNTAALKDILKQASDRYSHVNILIAPAVMQGENSAESVSEALREISKEKYHCDIIILSRGGGSLEDLMPFSDEKVARAIFDCPVPVISGIGHEIDHPISDDVADVAAATPTDAAKIAFPIVNDLLLSLEGVGMRLNRSMNERFKFLKEKLKRIFEKRIFLEPESLLEVYYRRLDELEMNLFESFREKIKVLKDVFQKVPELSYLYKDIFNERKSHFVRLTEKISAFSPIATLKRGYSLTYQKDELLRSIKSLDKTKDVYIQLKDGSFTAKPYQ